MITMFKYAHIITSAKEVEETSDIGNVVYVPLSLDAFIFLRSVDLPYIQVSSFFLSTNHDQVLIQSEFALQQVNSIKSRFLSLFDSEALFKDFLLYQRHNIMLIHLLMQVSQGLYREGYTQLISRRLVIDGSNPTFRYDTIVGLFVREYCAKNNYPFHEFGSYSFQWTNSRPLLYKTDTPPRFSKKPLFSPFLGYNIEVLLSDLSKKFKRPVITLDFLSVTSEPIFTAVLRSIKRLLLRTSGIHCISVRSSHDIISTSLDLLSFDNEIYLEEFDISPIINLKTSHMMPYLKSQYSLYKVVSELFDQIEPCLSVVYSTRGVTDHLCILAKEKHKPCLSVSHGTVVSSCSYLEHIYKKYIAQSVVHARGQVIAVQSPLCRGYFEQNYISENLIETKQLLFPVPKKRTSLRSKTLHSNRRPWKWRIVHAVTVKDFFNLQPLGSHLFDELLSEISEISLHLSPDYQFVLQVHPQVRSTLTEHAQILPDNVHVSKTKISEQLKHADALISFSSTSIEEALHARIPVILLDRFSRYKHCSSYNLDTSEYIDPSPVYYTTSVRRLASSLPYICKTRQSIVDWYKYTHTGLEGESLDSFFNSSLSC